MEKGIIRFGFGTGNTDRFALCRDRRWDELTKSFVAEGKDKGSTTRITNETRLFFEDDGSMLWITFMGERLCWGFLETDPAERHKDGDGVFRKVKDGWPWTDLNGEQLTKDRLSGSLTKIAGYRGTSCDVDRAEAEYLVRRINGQTTSGWRRQGAVGKTQKTLDLDLILPSTGERAFVQIKSKTDSAELAHYIGRFDELGPYERMFFVYHSGEAQTDDKRVIVIGPEKLAEMVVEAGLVNWLIRKVS